ncbi:tape measure protein [Cupriavidus necator]
MADNNRDVSLRVSATTSGTEDIQRLGAGLRDVGKAGADAAPGLERLALELDAAQAATKGFREAEASAKADAAQQKRSLDEQRDALAKLRAESDKAARSTDEYRAKERSLRLAIIDSRSALREKQAALSAAADAARGAAAAEQALGRQVQQVGAAYQQQAVQVVASAQQQTAAHARLTDGLKGIGDQLRTIQSLAAAAIGGQVLGGLAGDVAKTADAYSNLGARIRIVTGEGQAFEQAFQGVFDVATRTSSSLENTGTLFARIADAGKAINLTNADALRLTESINQAVQISGASAESSSAAVTQLIQGLQSGVLRGEEFNSVMEQAPRLAKALADGLGVTTGELRKLAEAGRLTADTVVGALQGQSAALQAEFAKMPATIGRAIQNLSTEWTRYVGEVDKANGASSAVASAINALARNLDTLGSLLYSAGKAAVAYQALKLAQTFLGIGTAARTATVEIAAMTAAQTAANAATGASAAGIGRFAAMLGGIKAFALIAVLTNLREIGTAIGEGAAKWMGYGEAIKDAERTMRAEGDAARANAAAKAELAQQNKLAAERALGLNDVSRKMIAEFEDVRVKGGSAADAIEKLTKSFSLGDVSGITNAGTALDALAQKGKITSLQVQEAWTGAMKGIDLGVFEIQARAAFDGSAQGARRLKAAVDAVADESLRRAGTSVGELQTGFNAASRSAINDTDALVKALDALGVKGEGAGRALSTSLNKAIDAATTERAVQAVIDRYEELGKQGKITGDQLAAGLERARTKLDGLAPGINSLNEALRTFGLKSRDELQQTADKMRTSWEQIRNDTTVSLSDKIKAFGQYSAAATAANKGVEDSEIAVQREMLRMEAAASGVGQAIGNAMDGAGARVDALGNQIGRVNDQLDRMEEGGHGNPKSHYNGSATVDQNDALAGLVEKQRASTLSADDLKVAQAAFQAASFNKKVLDQYRSQFSLEGAQSVDAAYKQARTILDQVQGAQAKKPGEANSPKTAQSAAHTVNISIAGKNTPVNVASEADANNLVGALRQLESMAGRSNV